MRIFKRFILLLVMIYFFAGYTFALSSTELIEKSKEYDQQTVSYFGEVVGEVMVRGNFAWINVYDGTSAIGVWGAQDLVKEIKFGGSYKYRGDRVEVNGLFNRACRQHGGDLDIHAQEIKIVKPGHEIYRPFNRSRLNLAIILSVISFVLIGLNIFLKKRRAPAQ